MKRYRMTEEQHQAILTASKPTPAMYLSGGQPMFPSPQENANAAWRKLGKEMGFKWDSVRPTGGDDRDFEAVEADPDA